MGDISNPEPGRSIPDRGPTHRPSPRDREDPASDSTNAPTNSREMVAVAGSINDRPDGTGTSFLGELRDAVAVRTIALIFGVLLLQMAFILSYVGAFHSPKPHHISFAVVAPASVTGTLTERLNALPGAPLKARSVTDAADARKQVARGDLSAALILNTTGTTDQLLTASAGGAAVSTAATTVITAVEKAQGRSVSVLDLVPPQSGDTRGLTGFYVVVGWIVGGYLIASLLGMAKGSRPATSRRAVIRLLAIVPYAVLSGLGGAIIVDPILGAITGHFLALWALGALVVAASASATTAFQVLFGVFGIGVTVLLFVVLGNTSAGGPYQGSLLPPFWRAIGPALPNGAGTQAFRRIVYFNANSIGGDLLVLTVYVVAGAAIALAASVRHNRTHPAT